MKLADAHRVVVENRLSGLYLTPDDFEDLADEVWETVDSKVWPGHTGFSIAGAKVGVVEVLEG